MSSSHLFHLSELAPQTKREGGYRVKATKSLFPILEGMSFYKLVLLKNAIREPHWHANADELGYCLKGQILVSLYANNNVKATFLVTPGEAFFVPSGTLHGIENIGEDTAEIILEFSNEEPEDFGLSSVFGMFTDAVLGNTWNVSQDKFKPLIRSTEEVFIAMRKGPVTISKDAHYSTPYRYSLEAASPLVSNEGGSARVARQDVWPIVEHQALYSLELTGKGMREPHWHPDTAELGYIQRGKGRISIQSPSGSVDTFEINPGDIYFIPKAYPHHIENLTDSPLHLLIFFDQPLPADIGFTGSVKSFSNEVLMAVFNSPADLFPSLPTYYKDLFIVNKVNPVDVFD
jgi:oxalate decarboxylase